VLAPMPLLLVALYLGEPVWPTQWGPLIMLALFSQVIGQGLLTVILGRVSPMVMGLGLLTQPIVAALAGWLAFGELLTLPDLAGAVLIGLALLIVRQPDKP
jgi:drug/metabolite transporter (DMT)-like permease